MDEPTPPPPPPLPPGLSQEGASTVFTIAPPPLPPPPLILLPFPGFLQSLLVIAILMAVQVLTVAVAYAISPPLIANPVTLGIANIVSFAAACLFAARRSGYPLGQLFRQAPPAGTFQPWSVVALLQGILGQLLCSVGLIYAIGGKAVEKSDYVDRLNKLLGPGQSLWAVIPLLVIVAPFTEETLFRGQFLRGFLGRYSPALAIALSAALFSAVHMNPVQIPATFMLGILSGFLYLRTRSIWPSIGAHMLNNAFPALAVMTAASRAKPAAKAGGTPEMTTAAALGLIVLGLSIWLLSLYSLRQWLPSAGPVEPPRTPEPVSPWASPESS